MYDKTQARFFRLKAPVHLGSARALTETSRENLTRIQTRLRQFRLDGKGVWQKFRGPGRSSLYLGFLPLMIRTLRQLQISADANQARDFLKNHVVVPTSYHGLQAPGDDCRVR